MNYDNSYHYQFIYLIIYSLLWQTDLHLHCREWDNLLNNGDWSPEVIAGTLPEFFRFVKKVQAIVLEGEGKKYFLWFCADSILGFYTEALRSLYFVSHDNLLEVEYKHMQLSKAIFLFRRHYCELQF